MKYMLSQQSTEASTELGNRNVASNGGQRKLTCGPVSLS